MRSAFTPLAWLPLLAAGALAWPAANAQGFVASYELTQRPVPISSPGFDQQLRGPGLFSLGPVRVSPSLQALPGGYLGTGLTLDTGNWSLRLSHSSLQQRLGLAVSYDWPRYFVRFSYDPALNTGPTEKLRFSAGLRF